MVHVNDLQVWSIRYVKFDTFTPAVERGLPVTRVISRMTLQQILAQAVGEEVIMNESNVVSFKDDGSKVYKKQCTLFYYFSELWARTFVFLGFDLLARG